MEYFNCMFYVQTGTLTEDGLDMWGVVPVENNEELGSPVRDVTMLSNNHSLKLGMITCHSLTLLNSTVSGDPLDIKVGTRLDDNSYFK